LVRIFPIRISQNEKAISTDVSNIRCIETPKENNMVTAENSRFAEVSEEFS
jgi:hypothetical protein